MAFALSLPAKLLVPLVIFAGIGAAILPADLNAVPKTVAATPAPATITPSFNMASIPVAAINRAPTISSPQAPPEVQPALWSSGWTTHAPAPATAIDATASLPTDTVNAAVNVRAAGQKGSPVLFVLPAGTQVHIAGTEDGWVHVYSDQGEGWIYASFVGARSPETQVASMTKVKATRAAGTVTVFDSPGGASLYRLDAGEPLRILETDGKWARIATESGEGGWVRPR